MYSVHPVTLHRVSKKDTKLMAEFWKILTDFQNQTPQ